MSLRIALLILILLPTVAFSRPTPPPSLLGVFDQLEAFEEALEDREWAEAQNGVEKTQQVLSELAPALKKERPQQTEDALETLNLLRDAVRDKSFSRAHASYLALQQHLVTVMDAYDYKIHPVLFLVDDFLEEAQEGLGGDDLEEVVNEMEEIEVLFAGSARHLLEQRGAAPAIVERFVFQVVEVRLAAETGDSTRAQKGLSELKKLFAVLSGTFGSR